LEKHSRILVAGSQTLAGKAIQRQLVQQGYTNFVDESGGASDLNDSAQVDTLFTDSSPEYVFLAAGKSGGIAANQKNPASLMIDNLSVVCNVIGTAHRHGVKKLLYLASSCCYPRECPQPMNVDSLFSGPLEPTNAAYATAKLAGVRLCEAYRQQYGSNFVPVIPANEFGPGDHFSLEDSHVIPALLRKMYEAKLSGAESVAIWGTGTPQREFIFVDDMADACIFVMREYDGSRPINIGGDSALSIKELAELIKQVVDYQGRLSFDTSRPDGMPIKMLDSSELMTLGWQPKTKLLDALSITYEWWSGGQHFNVESDTPSYEGSGVGERTGRAEDETG